MFYMFFFFFDNKMFYMLSIKYFEPLVLRIIRFYKDDKVCPPFL
jgi:hypothetical protein